MSFFDEADEPPRPTRPGPRQRRPSGGGRPPRDHQAIQTRRTIAVVALVVVIVLLAVGVHSCDVSQTNSALRDYTNSVSSIIGDSNATGRQLFADLSGGGGSNQAQSLQGKLTGLLASGSASADGELQRAENLSVPSQMQDAQRKLVLALRMRRDGVKVIADQIQQALGTTTNRDAITQIATATARFYASDVVYKAYAAASIAGALNAAGIQVGGTDEPSINAGQFLPNLGWLQPSFIAGRLGSRVSGGGQVNTAAPGVHGDSLTGVAVGSNTMAPGVTNHVASSPAPTFTLSVLNGGQFPEYNVGCKVTVTGLGLSGSSSIPQTTPGQTSTCSVTLSSPPTPGTYSVTATIATVPGEKDASNNSSTFTVQFQ